jgi:hypothetical protein
VAAAIGADCSRKGWAAGDPDDYRRIARAAIAAMREPTDGMVEVGSTDMALVRHGEYARDVWRDMIDEALRS